MTVTKLRSTRRLALGKSSGLAGAVTTRSSLALTRSTAGAGAYSFRAILGRRTLARGAIYVVHLSGTNARGKTKTLAIAFKA
jgi:hypothetical protein